VDNNGNIVWYENMPESLKKSKYTLQDVAKFTRYYLDDYPVRTYIVSEDRLLIVGKLNADIWKYTLEYDANNAILTFGKLNQNTIIIFKNKRVNYVRIFII